MKAELKNQLYFFYGTLQDPAVLNIVLSGLSTPVVVKCASLAGHELKRAQGEDFPILVKSSEVGVSAPGTLFRGICSEGRERLIYFEGEEYNLKEVKVGDSLAWCFFPSELGYGVDGAWDFDQWKGSTHSYELYLKQVRDYMNHYGCDEEYIWKS